MSVCFAWSYRALLTAALLGGQLTNTSAEEPAAARAVTLSPPQTVPATKEAAKPGAKAPSDKAPPAVTTADDDLELLEFLGSIDADNEDGDWLDFLRTTDIGKVAKGKSK